MVAIRNDLPQWAREQITKNRKKWTKDFRLYQLRARLITAIFRHLWFPTYDRDEKQLDHKFSIYFGWKNHIPIEIISNRNNLELVAKRENIKKSSGCSTTLGELHTNYLPNDKVSRIAGILNAIDDEEKLWRISLLVHEQYKNCNQKVGC